MSEARFGRERVRRLTAVPAALALAAMVAAGCGGGAGSPTGGEGLSGEVRIDGSSTVAPLAEAAAEMFQEQEPGVRVTVGTSGTGGGFERFCRGEVGIANASRPITDEERELCEENGIEFDPVHIANDGIAVVANPENDWAECLTVEQLRTIWDAGSKVDNWNQVDPEYPDQRLTLFGPGTDSGTFDYFTEAINGEAGRSRTDYNATEDDNVIVRGVSGEPGALGYFGLAYAEQNEDQLKVLGVDDGDGCVKPSNETVQSLEYEPLSRPLYLYASHELAQTPEGGAFLTFFVDNSTEIAQRALFVPLTELQQEQARETVERMVQGEEAPVTSTTSEPATRTDPAGEDSGR